jgi:hypothetical protein
MEDETMKYNSVENAKQFISDQIKWCKTNKYLNFTIWSNGKELHACTDTVTGKKPIEEAMRNGELKYKGFWKAIIYRDGHRIEF